MIKLKVKTKTETYPILIGSNLVQNISPILKKNSIRFNQCLIVIDKNVPKKITNEIIKSFKNQKLIKIKFNASEKNKNQKNVFKILEVLLKNNFSRQDCLISIGGGITGDVSGFAASLFKRGLQFINIPTTLLAQVDSSIGGKTGINTKDGKNLIGSFYQPKLVVSDTKFLKTLPPREIICGYGEILKHALIKNRIFYNYLHKNFSNIFKLKPSFIEKTIYESCKIKKDIVEKDEKEKGNRKVLNLGHTFAHAFEATLGYSKKLNHGEAVILGINSALKFSLKNKLLKKSDYNSITKHLYSANLPSDVKMFFKKKDLNKILSFMLKDKKNTSQLINLILLKNIGKPIIHMQYKLHEIKSFLNKELSN